METPSAIPFIRLDRTVDLIRGRMQEAWTSVLKDIEFVGGPAVQKLESALSQRLQVGHGVACANGTDALIVALQAVGVRPGMKVGVPNLTFWASYEAIRQVGAIPVLLDVDAADLQLDLDELKAAHQRFGLNACLIAHLFGWSSRRLAEIRDFCRGADIRLIEDGAQAYGVEVDGKSVFAGADVATLSFYPAKVLGGCHDGGAILFSDSVHAQLARKLCNHGRQDHYSYSHVGWNSRMSGINAHYLLALLEHEREIVDWRRNAEVFYREQLKDLEAAGLVRLHAPPEGQVGNGYLSVLEVDQAEQVAARLKERGVQSGRVYPQTLDQQGPCSSDLRVSALETSRTFVGRVLNLPLFFGITRQEQVQAADTLRRILEERSVVGRGR